jgi:hypothetical protein
MAFIAIVLLLTGLVFAVFLGLGSRSYLRTIAAQVNERPPPPRTLSPLAIHSKAIVAEHRELFPGHWLPRTHQLLVKSTVIAAIAMAFGLLLLL